MCSPLIQTDPLPTPGIVAEVLSIAVDGSHPLRFLGLESLRALADGGACHGSMSVLRSGCYFVSVI